MFLTFITFINHVSFVCGFVEKLFIIRAYVGEKFSQQLKDVCTVFLSARVTRKLTFWSNIMQGVMNIKGVRQIHKSVIRG